MSGEQGRIVAIGGSTGGIAAIKTLCDTLTPDIPAAVCSVIHARARPQPHCRHFSATMLNSHGNRG